MTRTRFTLLAIAFLALLLGNDQPAGAGPLTATQLLNDYNLIVFGDATSTSDVDGKSFIGGNLTGGNYDNHQVSRGGSIPALTVGKNLLGNVDVNGPGLAVGGNLGTSGYNGDGGGNAYIGGSWTGSANFNLNGSGNVYLGGTQTGTGNVNGGQLFTNYTSSAFAANVPTSATVNAVQNSLTSYSAALAGLTQNSLVTLSNGTANFNAAPNSQGVAVFKIANATSFFSAVSQITFNLNGASELVVDISGAGASPLNIAANFLGGQAQSLATDTIWNFIDAQDVTINNQFGGDVLAPYAALTLKGNEEGTLVAQSLVQNAEVHFDGADTSLVAATPLPATAYLFVGAFGLMLLMARRRRWSDVMA